MIVASPRVKQCVLTAGADQRQRLSIDIFVEKIPSTAYRKEKKAGGGRFDRNYYRVEMTVQIEVDTRVRIKVLCGNKVMADKITEL